MKSGIKTCAWFLVLAVWACGAPAVAQAPLVVQGGTLVNVADGSLVKDAVIVLEGDRIVSVSPAGKNWPPHAAVIDAAGKYILPGLIDPHLHYRDYTPELYLNHGVTTVCDLGNPFEWIKAQAEAVAKGRVPGPRLFYGTPHMDGPPANLAQTFVKEDTIILKNAEEAHAVARKFIAEGASAVKVYERLTLDMLRALGEEANKSNLMLYGHWQDVRDAFKVAGEFPNLRIGIEHTRAVAPAVTDKEAREEALKKVRQGFDAPVQCFMDPKKVPGIAQLMAQKKLFLNPTLRAEWAGDQAMRDTGFQYEDFDLLFNDWRLRYVPLQFKLAELKGYVQTGLWHWRDLSPYERDLFHRGYTNVQLLVKSFVDAGGKLVAGTDSGVVVVAGLSLHQEMELMVKAGVSPLQALQAATINSAEVLGKQDQLGSIAEGKLADLVILDANPLEDIRNTRKIARVISRGRLLSGKYDPDFKNPFPRTDSEDSVGFFPSPFLRKVSPETMVEGGPEVTLTVQGSGFIPYSLVRFSGRKLKTAFVDPFQLTAEVPAELLAPGTQTVTVENPDFAWGTTSAPGATNLVPLGVRPPVSNEIRVVVRYR